MYVSGACVRRRLTAPSFVTPGRMSPVISHWCIKMAVLRLSRYQSCATSMLASIRRQCLCVRSNAISRSPLVLTPQACRRCLMGGSRAPVSTAWIQKRPSPNSRSNNNCRRMNERNTPYISAKEPYVSGKEPYASAKEPYVSAK